MVLKKICWLFWLCLILGCEKPELDLKSGMLAFPPAEVEPELARLNPDLNFRRVLIGTQVRIAVAYTPGQDLKIACGSRSKLKFYFGVLPFYFSKYHEPVSVQVLFKDEDKEQEFWSFTISPEQNPSWHLAELVLPEKSGEVILRSGIKDYGLAITPPSRAQLVADSRPSIIFILIDALRADHLGAYGYPRDTSPNLDALAQSGALFLNAMSASSFTVTSLASMFTGLNPWEHRALFSESLILRENLETLAMKLKASGYQTAGFSATYFRLSDFQLDRGFELFDEECEASFFLNDAECLTQKVMAWLETEADSPFFLYLHYVSPHSPYHPPLEYKKLFSAGLEKPKGPPGLGDLQPFGDNRKWYQIPRAPKKQELDWLISQYDGEIRYADTEIGKLLTKLSELGVKDNTLILVTADHGEAFFEHKKMAHAEETHWEVIRIPLILSGPGIPAGIKINELVRSIDYAPFLLEYAGAQPLAKASGKSLLPLLSGTEMEKRIGYFFKPKSQKSYQIGIIDYPYHFLIREPGNKKIELYDLSLDPSEQTNLRLTKPELVSQFMELLPDQNLILFGPARWEKELRPETKERLKTLGYTK